jgi:hypothetical protein
MQLLPLPNWAIAVSLLWQKLNSSSGFQRTEKMFCFKKPANLTQILPVRLFNWMELYLMEKWYKDFC